MIPAFRSLLVATAACLLCGAVAVRGAGANIGDLAPDAQAPVACDITGLVSGLENIRTSPWRDGTPSPFSETEVHVLVTVEGRSPHGGAETAACGAPKSPQVTYKLCSPTPVSPGDHIHGTEGLTPLAAGVSCLFDVAVLPKG